MGSGLQSSRKPDDEAAAPCGRAPAAAGPRGAAAAQNRPAGGDRRAIAAIAGALGAMVLVGLGILFLWLTFRVDLVIFAGLLLAIVLRRLAEWVSGLTGIAIGRALALVIVLTVLFCAGIGWLFSQEIAGQIAQLSVQLPAALTTVARAISRSELGKIVLAHVNLGAFRTSPAAIAARIFGAAANLAEVAGAAVVIVVIGIYAAAEAPLYTGGALRLVPPPRRPRAAAILHRAADAVWYWLLGRLLAMTLLGAMATAGLWLLGVPLPFALGFLVGLMSFVPYLGSVASALPCVLIAAAAGLALALYVILLFILIHMVEGYLLVPLVQRRLVHLPPALTLSAQLVLGAIAGIPGLVLATPLVAAALVLVRMIYVEDVLGDRTDCGSGRPQ
jgi:predicted PurR-regulated permease PerM